MSDTAAEINARIENILECDRIVFVDICDDKFTDIEFLPRVRDAKGKVMDAPYSIEMGFKNGVLYELVMSTDRNALDIKDKVEYNLLKALVELAISEFEIEKTRLLDDYHRKISQLTEAKLTPIGP